MDISMGINWCDYFRCLSDDQMRELATWLAADSLKVSEFTDIVDRVYAQASDEWHGRSPAFVATYGRPIMERYVRRRRGFVEVLAAVEDAKMSGALPGNFVSQELQPIRKPQPEPRSVEDVLSALEHLRGIST
jgi:hypothetical protein